MKIGTIFNHKKMKEHEVDFEGKWDAVAKRRMQWARKRSRSNPRNFAMIAKISLELRKFPNHSENFAILAKLGNFAS